MGRCDYGGDIESTDSTCEEVEKEAAVCVNVRVCVWRGGRKGAGNKESYPRVQKLLAVSSFACLNTSLKQS